MNRKKREIPVQRFTKHCSSALVQCGFQSFENIKTTIKGHGTLFEQAMSVRIYSIIKYFNNKAVNPDG